MNKSYSVQQCTEHDNIIEP